MFAKLKPTKKIKQTQNQIDKYAWYLGLDPSVKDALVNKRNLFADANTDDQQWLKIARFYLRKTNVR